MSLKRTQLSHYDPFKGDMWASGLVLFQAITLEKAKSIYNYRLQ